MRRVLSAIRRARGDSSRGTDKVEDVRVVGLIRRAIPRFYIAVAVFGILGAIGGTPALRQTFGETYAQYWSLLVAATALACLAGFVFPRLLWRVEAVGAMLLNGWIFAYIAALIFAVIEQPDIGRLGVGAILFASTELPWWRVQDIYLQRYKEVDA